MKAYITSIGEPTTPLAVWSLKRNGFRIMLLDDPTTSLAQKLDYIYKTEKEDFIRVDADVVVNKLCTPKNIKTYEQKNIWWYQFKTFCWLKQTRTNGGVQYIKSEAIPIIQKRTQEFINAERPESQLYRLKELTTPVRRCVTVDTIMGLHGYKQNDKDRIQETKKRRKQTHLYDFELAERLEQL